MTQAVADPFATDAETDPFSQPTGGGKYPKVEDLEGMLVLIKPYKIETVPNRFSKDPNATQDRATADVIVFGTPGTEPIVHSRMYFSQGSLVKECRAILDASNPNKPFALGRIEMFPAKAAKDAGINTTAELKKALAEWVAKGGKGERPAYAWGLAKFTEEDANQARPVALALMAKTNPFA